MTKRIFLAGILGGVAMFLWASLAHMVLPLGRAGIREVPDDRALLASMRSALGESSGLYMFPGVGSDADMKRYEQKLASNPSGLLIYHPPGVKALTPGQLITEFLTELLEALLLAWLMAQTRLESLPARLGFAIVVGIVAGITTNVSYWNWYGFPSAYTLPYMSIEIVGFLVAGLVAAKMLGRSSLGSVALTA
jgi:hypothetical protein